MAGVSTVPKTLISAKSVRKALGFFLQQKLVMFAQLIFAKYAQQMHMHVKNALLMQY